MLLLLCNIYLDYIWTYCILLIIFTSARSYSSVFKSIMPSDILFLQIRIIITIIISICGNYLSRPGSYCFDHFKIRSFVIYFDGTFTPSFCGPQLAIFIHFGCNICVLCMYLLYIVYTIFLFSLSVSILSSNIRWDFSTSFEFTTIVLLYK